MDNVALASRRVSCHSIRLPAQSVVAPVAVLPAIAAVAAVAAIAVVAAVIIVAKF